MILVDTSIWVDHFRAGKQHLAELLDQQKVLIHPMIIGELACGNLQNRAVVLKLLSNLLHVKKVSDSEVLYFIEQNSFMGRGVGFIDFHLLVSVAITNPSLIWTKDKKLQKIANEIGLSYRT